MLRDKSRFSRRLHGVKKVKNPEVSSRPFFKEMAQEIEQAAGRVLLREASRPTITPTRKSTGQPEKMKMRDLQDMVRDHQAVIVAGRPVWQTTQLPKICMEPGRRVKGLIVLHERVVWRAP